MTNRSGPAAAENLPIDLGNGLNIRCAALTRAA
jgi:hypothetical protein